MKIGYLTAAFGSSGAGLAAAIHSIIGSLENFGDYSFVNFGERTRDMWPANVEFVPTRKLAPESFSYRLGLAKAVVEAQIDLIHAHGLWTHSSIATQQWQRRTGRPYIVSPHGMLDSWALNQSRTKKRIGLIVYERRNLARATCVHALTTSEQRDIRRITTRPPIAVIPNAVQIPDQERIHRGRARIRSIPGKKRLLFLGRIHKKKGVTSLIDAWVTLNASSPRLLQKWELRICGWGTEKDIKDLKLKLSNAGDSAAMAFVGAKFGEEKFLEFAAADAFILPSLSEGLPMGVLEAWSMGLPVIMSPECNLPEGFAANAAIEIGASTNEIARGLKVLGSLSEEALQIMGSNGYDLARSVFSPMSVGEKFSRLYAWALTGQDKPNFVTLE